MNYKFKSFLIVTLILLMVLSETIFSVFSVFKYIDEGLTILLGLIIIFKLGFLKRHNRPLFILFLLYGLLVFIGLMNNLIFKVQPNFTAILIDVVATVKLIVFIIGFYLVLDPHTNRQTFKLLAPIAKVFIFLGFVFSIVNLLVDIGMRGQTRFGIPGYNFIFTHAHTYSMFTFFFLLILVATTKKGFTLGRFAFYAIVQTALTLKGPSIIWGGLFILFLLYFKRFRKVGVIALVVAGLLVLALGTYQIQAYFLTPSAPRSRLFSYGFQTLLDYHFLGSGFATFGSYASAIYYSPLYVKYGFEGVYGMSSTDYQFLSDNYWPSVMAQFGLIGLLIVVGMAIYMFKVLQSKHYPSTIKAVLFSCYFYLLLHSIGSSTPTISAAAVMAIGMVMVVKSEDYRLAYKRYVYEKEKDCQAVDSPANAV